MDANNIFFIVVAFYCARFIIDLLTCIYQIYYVHYTYSFTINLVDTYMWRLLNNHWLPFRLDFLIPAIIIRINTFHVGNVNNV